MDNYMYSPKYLNVITHNKLVYYQYPRSGIFLSFVNKHTYTISLYWRNVTVISAR